jgi:hypothetical protein
MGIWSTWLISLLKGMRTKSRHRLWERCDWIKMLEWAGNLSPLNPYQINTSHSLKLLDVQFMLVETWGAKSECSTVFVESCDALLSCIPSQQLTRVVNEQIGLGILSLRTARLTSEPRLWVDISWRANGNV